MSQAEIAALGMGDVDDDIDNSQEDNAEVQEDCELLRKKADEGTAIAKALGTCLP